jgi:multiple sugar transport system permease protein
MTIARKQAMTAYAFLLVPLSFFLFVRFFPMLYALVMGLTNWGLTAKNVRFIGLDNFRTIFTDKVFLVSLANTARYALIGAPLAIGLSLFFAMQLNAVSRGRGLFRLIYVIPYITPVVAVSWVWRWILQPPPIGVLNNLLTSLGLGSHGFLLDHKEALLTITAVNVWVELGYCVTIFLAGIQNIPNDFIEAAKIDGASGRTILSKIILPLLLPVTLFLTVMQSIQFMRIFTQVYNMSYQSQGGPLDSTKSVALYIYQTAFTKFQLGLAASASLVLFAIIMLITLVQMKFFDKQINY